MLDAPPHTRLDARQQAAAPAYDRCQALSGCRPAWYVVATYPKAERRAHAALHLKGYTAYLPLITARRADRSYHTGPMFSGYCFVRLDLSRPWYPIRYAPGVFQLLAIDGMPTPCPDGAVEAVKEAEAAAVVQLPLSLKWAPGVPVAVSKGALAGWPAVITQVGHNMATVAVMMFGALREVAVQLDCLVARDN